MKTAGAWYFQISLKCAVTTLLVLFSFSAHADGATSEERAIQARTEHRFPSPEVCKNTKAGSEQDQACRSVRIKLQNLDQRLAPKEWTEDVFSMHSAHPLPEEACHPKNETAIGCAEKILSQDFKNIFSDLFFGADCNKRFNQAKPLAVYFVSVCGSEKSMHAYHACSADKGQKMLGKLTDFRKRFNFESKITRATVCQNAEHAKLEAKETEFFTAYSKTCKQADFKSLFRACDAKPLTENEKACLKSRLYELNSSHQDYLYAKLSALGLITQELDTLREFCKKKQSIRTIAAQCNADFLAFASGLREYESIEKAKPTLQKTTIPSMDRTTLRPYSANLEFCPQTLAEKKPPAKKKKPQDACEDCKKKAVPQPLDKTQAQDISKLMELAQNGNYSFRIATDDPTMPTEPQIQTQTKGDREVKEDPSRQNAPNKNLQASAPKGSKALKNEQNVQPNDGEVSSEVAERELTESEKQSRLEYERKLEEQRRLALKAESQKEMKKALDPYYVDAQKEKEERAKNCKVWNAEHDVCLVFAIKSIAQVRSNQLMLVRRILEESKNKAVSESKNSQDKEKIENTFNEMLERFAMLSKKTNLTENDLQNFIKTIWLSFLDNRKLAHTKELDLLIQQGLPNAKDISGDKSEKVIWPETRKLMDAQAKAKKDALAARNKLKGKKADFDAFEEKLEKQFDQIEKSLPSKEAVKNFLKDRKRIEESLKALREQNEDKNDSAISLFDFINSDLSKLLKKYDISVFDALSYLFEFGIPSVSLSALGSGSIDLSGGAGGISSGGSGIGNGNGSGSGGASSNHSSSSSSDNSDFVEQQNKKLAELKLKEFEWSLETKALLDSGKIEIDSKALDSWTNTPSYYEGKEENSLIVEKYEELEKPLPDFIIFDSMFSKAIPPSKTDYRVNITALAKAASQGQKSLDAAYIKLLEFETKAPLETMVRYNDSIAKALQNPDLLVETAPVYNLITEDLPSGSDINSVSDMRSNLKSYCDLFPKSDLEHCKNKSLQVVTKFSKSDRELEKTPLPDFKEYTRSFENFKNSQKRFREWVGKNDGLDAAKWLGGLPAEHIPAAVQMLATWGAVNMREANDQKELVLKKLYVEKLDLGGRAPLKENKLPASALNQKDPSPKEDTKDLVKNLEKKPIGDAAFSYEPPSVDTVQEEAPLSPPKAVHGNTPKSSQVPRSRVNPPRQTYQPGKPGQKKDDTKENQAKTPKNSVSISLRQKIATSASYGIFTLNQISCDVPEATVEQDSEFLNTLIDVLKTQANFAKLGSNSADSEDSSYIDKVVRGLWSVEGGCSSAILGPKINIDLVTLVGPSLTDFALNTLVTIPPGKPQIEQAKQKQMLTEAKVVRVQKFQSREKNCLEIINNKKISPQSLPIKQCRAFLDRSRHYTDITIQK